MSRLATAAGAIAVLVIAGFVVLRHSTGSRPPASGDGTRWGPLPQVVDNAGAPPQAAVRPELSEPGSKDADGGTVDKDLHWVSDRQPMVVDTNSDGVQDVVGWVRSFDPASDSIAAFDLTSGKRLWTTVAFGPPSASIHAAAVDNKLLVADGQGTLRGFSLANGQEIWAAPMDERAERICGAGAGTVRIDRKDERKVVVNLTTGKVTPAGRTARSDGCEEIATDQAAMIRHRYNLVDDAIIQPRIAGMSIETLFTDSGSNVWVALGAREIGTHTPMVAGFRPMRGRRQRGSLVPAWMEPVPAKPLWLVTIASRDPLSVKAGARSAGIVAGDRVFACYDTQATGESHLVAIDVATGQHVWDVPMPPADANVCASTIAASEQYVVVGRWNGLEVFDRVSGNYRLRIGGE